MHKFVTERNCESSFRPELTVCKPDLYFSALEHYNSSQNDDQSDLMLVIDDMLAGTDHGESIVSTAEEHFKLQTVNLAEITTLCPKPKSTSSVVSLAKLISKSRKVKKSTVKPIKFNAEFTSTPKKQSRRLQQPFSSTVISEKQQNLKTIPPPISSSSFVDMIKSQKRKRTSSSRIKSSAKKPAIDSSCAMCCKRVVDECCPAVKPAKKQKRSSQQQVVKYYPNLRLKLDASNVYFDLKKKTTEANSIQLPRIASRIIKNLKYPIKFCPNMRTRDVLFESELVWGTTSSTCTVNQEYNVWYV